MFGKIISLLSKCKEFLKGKKIYIASVILILQAVLGYLGQLIDLSSLADFVNWCGALAGNEYTARLIEGLGIFGLRFAFGASAKKESEAPADR